MTASRRSRSDGFTLIEMLAVVALTTLVLTVAINFFIDLSRASNASTDRMRGERRATALVDRIARDLEGAYLVKKPAETDPLEHPWLFLAESTGAGLGNGADRLKFMTRTPQQRTTDEHEGDVAVVAYGARPAPDGGLEIVRWSSPGLPTQLDRTIPLDESADALVLASGVASFSVRLLDDAGTWQESWDSSQITDSSELPVGAEIQVSMLPPPGATAGVATATDGGELAAVGPFVRRVLIPVRPIDLAALLRPDEAAAAASGTDQEKADEDKKDDPTQQASAQNKSKDEDESCMTVAQCLALNPGILQQFPQIGSIISSIGGQCFRDVAGSIPPGINLAGCR